MKVSCSQLVAFLLTIITLVHGRYAYPRAAISESFTAGTSAISSMSSSSSIRSSGSSITAVFSSTATTSAAPTPTLDSSIFLNGTLTGSSFEITEEPLVPVITPALSIAGVLLMISGAIYAAIGVKHERILVFLSVAYLTALAITVLELFLITTPITSAIQGGYFVGVAVPALIVGALSLFFQDMLHGIGAPLGGFSLAMFILCTHDGGVLKSTLAKAIFIGCWTAFFFALQFVQCLRIYILIGSTSLAGATAIVLGIDCFSLAGLGEFWVYIWALNNHYFPDENFVYQVSRGMIVQLGAILILTCCGILSQVRIWKVIKKQKDIRSAARLEEHRQRDEFETELGRVIADTQVREKREWERAYSEKKAARQSVHEIAVEDKHHGSFSIDHDVSECADDCSEINDRRTESTRLRQQQAAEDTITPVDSDGSDPSTATRPSSRTSLSHKTQSVADDEAKELVANVAISASGANEREVAKDQYHNGKSAGSKLVDTEAQVEPFKSSIVDNSRRLSVLTTTSIWAMIDENEDHRKRLSQLDLPDVATSSKSSSTYEDHFDRGNDANASPYGSIAGSWPEETGESDSRQVATNGSDDDLARLVEEPKFFDAPESSVGAEIRNDVEFLTKGLSTSMMNETISATPKSSDTKSPVNQPSIRLQTASQHQPSTTIQQHRTGEWAKHVESGVMPDTAEDIPASMDEELPAVPDEADLLRTISPSVPSTRSSANTESRISPENSKLQVPAASLQRSTGSTSKQHIDAPRSFTKRMSSAPNLTTSAISLPRNSDPKKVLKRQIQTPTSTNRMSVLASPIDEEAIASFPAAPAPEFRRRPNRASLPLRSQTEPTLIDTIQQRQSRASLHEAAVAAGLPYMTSLSNQERPKSAILPHQPSMELINHHRLSQNMSPPLQDFARRASWQESSFAQHAPPVQVPEHTLHRASMLAEWRRSNSMEQMDQARAMSPPLVQTPNYSPAGVGPNQWQQQHQQQQEARRSASQASMRLSNPTINRGSSQGPDLNITNTNPVIPRYTSPAPRQPRPISIQEYENAHRDALRRMQAGANRALKTSGQY